MRTMTTLNHANLTTYDVPALTEFFQNIFGLQVIDQRGGSLAVLRDASGFVLTLMRDKAMSPENGYPGFFHVGFLQPSKEAVNTHYEALAKANYAAPKPAKLQRGGPPTYGFYCQAPGGVTVEVSTMNA
jgi:catechol-2,3-dioxygenase